jgi:hypothetical protein
MKHKHEWIVTLETAAKRLKPKDTVWRCLAILALALAPLSAWGAAIDALTIFESGGNTHYTITGTFPADFNPSFGSPNTPYTIAFFVPTSPTSFSFADSAIGVFVLDASVTLNGVTYSNSQVAFFTPDLDGGVDVCINDICAPSLPTTGPKFVVLTNPIQLFTGPADLPTLISGAVTVDTIQSFIETPVPEPGSISLAALGMGVLAYRMRRNRRRNISRDSRHHSAQ